MNKKQVIIILLIISVILGLCSFLFIKNKEKQEHYLYLFTGDTKIVRWYYNDETWYIANTNEKLSDKFDVYNNGKYLGNYSLMYNKGWYYFDSSNRNVQVDGITFMVNTNYILNSYEYNTNYKKDDNIASKIAKKINIDYLDYNYNLRIANVVNNSKLELIYFIDFYEKNSEYNQLGPNYTVAAIIKNNQVIIIKSLNFSSSSSGACNLNLNGVFTFNDNNNNILLSCTHFDQIPSDYYLYKEKDNTYELVVDSLGGA